MMEFSTLDVSFPVSERPKDSPIKSGGGNWFGTAAHLGRAGWMEHPFVFAIAGATALASVMGPPAGFAVSLAMAPWALMAGFWIGHVAGPMIMAGRAAWNEARDEEKGRVAALGAWFAGAWSARGAGWANATRLEVLGLTAATAVAGAFIPVFGWFAGVAAFAALSYGHHRFNRAVAARAGIGVTPTESVMVEGLPSGEDSVAAAIDAAIPAVREHGVLSPLENLLEALRQARSEGNDAALQALIASVPDKDVLSVEEASTGTAEGVVPLNAVTASAAAYIADRDQGAAARTEQRVSADVDALQDAAMVAAARETAAPSLDLLDEGDVVFNVEPARLDGAQAAAVIGHIKDVLRRMGRDGAGSVQTFTVFSRTEGFNVRAQLAAAVAASPLLSDVEKDMFARLSREGGALSILNREAAAEAGYLAEDGRFSQAKYEAATKRTNTVYVGDEEAFDLYDAAVVPLYRAGESILKAFNAIRAFAQSA